MRNKIPKTTWVVLPGYNEGRYLPEFLKKLLKITKNIILVDDGSSDQTAQIAEKYLKKHVLVHGINLGKGAALKTGCDYAFDVMKAKSVIIMDSDDQHSPDDLILFAKALKSKNLVLGVREFNKKMPLLRRLGNSFASVIVKILFGRYIPDILSGYKAFDKKTYKKLRWKASDYSVELEIAAKISKHNLDFSLVTVETIYHEMDRGMNLIDTIKILTRLLKLRINL